MRAKRLPHLLSAAALAALLAACAAPGSTPAGPEVPWRDAAFAYAPGRDAPRTLDAVALFALDAQALQDLRSRLVTTGGKARAHAGDLLELVFGPGFDAFAYAGGHSTTAAETWRNRRGDCLSLSIMTVALARALGLPAQIQEVRVPPLIDRRGTVDFLNQHVNVLVPSEHDLRSAGRILPAGLIVVDFEPRPGSRSRGRALADQQVLARFLNNRAAEHLAGGDTRLAYAHFKAAIGADPGFGPAYGNLAQLYLGAGLQAEAEALLRIAVAFDDSADFALAALHQLLLTQGRAAEAHPLEAALAARRERDPYYWLALGLRRLQDEQWHDAAAALERAQALTSGFAEVHQALAVAYARDGRLHQARDQLALLASLGIAGGVKSALLQRKLGIGDAAGSRQP